MPPPSPAANPKRGKENVENGTEKNSDEEEYPQMVASEIRAEGGEGDGVREPRLEDDGEGLLRGLPGGDGRGGLRVDRPVPAQPVPRASQRDAGRE